MNTGDEMLRRSNDNYRAIVDALIARGFHDIDATLGNSPKVILSCKKEEAAIPFTDALPLINSSETKESLWKTLRQMNLVRPK
jgi:hypothetical protein